MQFSAAFLFHLAVESDQLARFEAVAQVSAVEPDALQAGPALAGRHLEDGHAAGSKQARCPDFGDDRGHLAYSKFGDAAGIYAVFVAKRQVMEQVVDSVDALCSQHFGQARADALDVLDRGRQLQHPSDVSRIGGQN